MGKYIIEIKETARKDLAKNYKSGDKASINRIEQILKVLESHPATGIGNPEQLKYAMNFK